MKKNLQLFLLFVLLSNFSFAQSLNEIEKFASNYDKTFDALEKNMNIKPFDRVSKFGLESRMYLIKAFKILVESDNEENKISKISFLTERSERNGELWYNIAKTANSDQGFMYVDSFISGKEDDIYEKDVDFTKMVGILRKSKALDDYLYYIKFKKNNLLYSFNMGDKTFYCVISKNQKQVE